MAVPTLGSISLYGCNEIRKTESGNILPITFPTKGSEDTEVFDMLGAQRIVGISGTATNSQPSGSPTSASSKEDALLGLIDGNQDTIAFVDHNGKSIDVMVAEVGIIWDLPGNKFTYEIKLMRGKQG